MSVKFGIHVDNGLNRYNDNTVSICCVVFIIVYLKTCELPTQSHA